MITVPEAAEKIIRRSRYLSEALSKDIINISSLSRYIRPEIEGILAKKVSVSAVIMALKRLKGSIEPATPYLQILTSHPEITVKTNLALVVSQNPATEVKKSVSMTISPTGTIMLGAKDQVFDAVDESAKLYYPVSSISISIPKEAINMPGIYYFFLKSLAWERINVLNIFTAPTDITIVVEDNDTQRALGILKSLFEEIT